MSSSAPPTSRRHLLLVDDDSITLDLLTHTLEHAGFSASRAESAEAALAAVQASEPDLALLDISMPGMSGMELAKRLQAEHAVPFMFLSGRNDAGLVREAAGHGALGCLVKPFEPCQVVPAVEAALARAEEIRCLRRAESNLSAALAAGRETSMAVGLLMARLQTDRATAFEVLRDYARSTRTRLNEVAQEMLAAEERISALKTMIAVARNKR